jgi:hypothetical protein
LPTANGHDTTGLSTGDVAIGRDGGLGEACGGLDGARGLGHGIGPGGGGEFWAVPGVERASERVPYRPGSVGVAGYQLVAGALVDAVGECVGPVTAIGEVIAAAHLACDRLAVLVNEAGGAVGHDPAVLDHLTGVLNLANKVNGLTRSLVAAADRTGVCQATTGVDLGSWLCLKANFTRSQASKLVLGARQAVGFELLARAGLAGAVNVHQVDAVSAVLKLLPAELDRERVDLAEEVLVGMADRHASDSLGRASEEVLERIAPKIAEREMEAKAERQLKRAERKRYCVTRDLGDGTASLSALLPVADGLLVRSVLDKLAERRIRQQADAKEGRTTDRGQARADGLVEICRHVQQCGQAGWMGGSGATLMVSVGLDDLIDGGKSGRLVANGEPIDSLTLKTLACDSDMVRVVLGAKGEPLDIGRKTRAIPAGLRRALAWRDRGCCFPGCDRPVEACQAHHVVPWTHGGRTSLGNLVCVCAHHHRLIEPPKSGDPPWRPRLRGDGLWEFIPPPWLDPKQVPLLNDRFKSCPK